MFVLYKRTFNRRQGLQLLVLLINEPGRALLPFDAPRPNSLPVVEGVGGGALAGHGQRVVGRGRGRVAVRGRRGLRGRLGRRLAGAAGRKHAEWGRLWGARACSRLGLGAFGGHCVCSEFGFSSKQKSWTNFVF